MDYARARFHQVKPRGIRVRGDPVCFCFGRRIDRGMERVHAPAAYGLEQEDRDDQFFRGVYPISYAQPVQILDFFVQRRGQECATGEMTHLDTHRLAAAWRWCKEGVRLPELYDMLCAIGIHQCLAAHRSAH